MFPKDWDEAEKKQSPEWGRQWAQAILQWHRANYNQVNFPQGRILQRLLYSYGNQPKFEQRKPVDPAKDNDNQTLPGATRRNLELASTILDALVGKMMKIRMKPSVTMIDEFSRDMRIDIEAKLRQVMEYQRMGVEVAELLKQYGMEAQDVPLDMEEYQLKVDMLPQLEEEVQLETASTFVFDRNDFEVIERDIIRDLFVNNISMLRYYTINGERIIRRCDPQNSGTSIFTTEDGRDLIFAYEIRNVPASEVRRQMELDPNVTPEEITQVVGDMGGTMTGITYSRNNNQGGYTGFSQQPNSCIIMEFEIFSPDQFYAVVKNGKTYFQYKKETGSETRFVQKIGQIQNVYSGMYVCDMNILYNWKRKNDIIREPIPVLETMYDRSNPANAYGSFMVYQLKGKSIVDRMMPHIDVIGKLWDKIQDANDAYIPQIINFDLEAIAEVVVDGKKQSQQQLVDNFLRKGILPTTSAKYGGRSNVSRNQALSVQANSGWEGIQFMVNQFTTHISLLQNVCGIPPEVTGAHGNPEQGKYVTQLTLQGTDNVLNGYLFARQKLLENLNRVMVFDFMANGVRGFSGTKEFFIEPELMIGRIPNVKIVVLPTEEKIQYLLAEGQKAYDAGVITMADKLKLFNMLEAGKIRQAEAYFSIKDKRARLQQAQSSQQQMEVNAQIQQQSLQLANEAKMQIEAMKGDQKIMLQQMQNQATLQSQLLGYLLESGKKNLDLQTINNDLQKIEA